MSLLPRTLRGRVALATALASLLALGALGATLALLVDRELHRSLDRSLRLRAADVARLVATAPALVGDSTALEGPLGATPLSVQIVDRQARIVSRSTGLGARVLPVDLARPVIRSGTGHLADAVVGGQHLRLYVAPLSDAGGQAAGGAVLVAASTGELDDTLHHVHVLLALATLIAAALAATAATLLTRRATRPLARLATSAGEIERTSDAARRLPVEAGADEVRRLAETLNAMLAALERARASERRFVDDASHELRTPVTALRGNVEYVARHGADPAVVADLVGDSERLSRLLDDLLALAREDAAAPPVEHVDLAAVARAAGHADPLVDVAAPDPVIVRGDALALERLLRNLVENAHRHGPAGGRVALAVRAVDGRARLSLRDQGPGVRAEDREHVFERFWQRASGSGGGSGLGLAIVRQVAERHGGRAWVDDEGFAVELPLAG